MFTPLFILHFQFLSHFHFPCSLLLFITVSNMIFKLRGNQISNNALVFSYASSSTLHPGQSVGDSQFRTSVAWSLRACQYFYSFVLVFLLHYFDILWEEGLSSANYLQMINPRSQQAAGCFRTLGQFCCIVASTQIKMCLRPNRSTVLCIVRYPLESKGIQDLVGLFSAFQCRTVYGTLDRRKCNSVLQFSVVLLLLQLMQFIE